MSRAPQSRGACGFCGQEFAKAGLTRHLKTCAKRLEAQAAAEKTRRTVQKLHHLQVQDAWGGNYWLHLEIRDNATLANLDHYLREIWLECCGHLSAFEIGDISYASSPDPWGESDDRSMAVKVGKVFAPGMTLHYEYDFGSTTELTIKVLDERAGKPLSEHPIFLMARNKFEAPTCMECDQPAVWFCTQCPYDRADERGELCEEHAKEHEHEDMVLALVNSPRVGVCGYSGPAEPPY
jgi:hypothetical protein